MPPTTLGLILLLGLLLANSLFATARTALVGASRSRLRQMAEGGHAGAARAARVAEDATPLMATLRLAQTLARFFAAGLIAYLYEPLLAGLIRANSELAAQADPLALFALMLLAALIIVSLGEFLPEAWVMRAPEPWAIFFAPIVQALVWLLSPFVRLMLFVAARVSAPLAGRQLPFVTEEEIKTMVDAGEEGGVLEEEEKEMIYSIFEFGETLAREIMVPRIDVVALDVDTPVPQAVEVALGAGHSRIPVYQDNIDNLLGLLYAKDLLRVWKEGGPMEGLRGLLRPAFFVPETKKVDELLAELQQKRIHLAVVVDEYGGTAGIVTMEDIVEEIVGEIRDEYDVNEESLFERVAEGEYLFDARIDLDEVNELLGLELPSDESDSLGGYIYGQLGHVPAPGEKVRGPRVEFEVLTVTGRRIRKVRGLRLADEPAAANGAQNGAAEGRRTNGHATPSEALKNGE
jgi:CBS domain containing-hemolysin-like protein